MAKVNVSELIELLKNAGASDEDIPKLVMISYYESNFDTKAKNATTDALGLFQINASAFYDKDDNPDPTLSSFFGGNNLDIDEFEKKLTDPQYNANFAVHYLADLKKSPNAFPDVKRAGGDPFAQWEAYGEYVKPYLEGKKITGRGPDPEAKRNDVVTGVGTYLDAFVQVHMNQTAEDIVSSIDDDNIKVPERGETKNKLPESMTQLYNREGVPTYVDSQIVQDLLQTGKYTEQPVSVEEGQEEKEVKDVITAHIYSYLQKQKDVYAKKNPNSAREVR